jgi:tripartite-type tricarboxylate transporter receptor subunit TctC
MSQSADYRKRLEKMYRVPDFKSGADARRSLDEQYTNAKEILTELGLAKD